MPRLDDSSLDTTQRVGSCNVTRGSGPASYNYRNVTQTTSDQPWIFISGADGEIYIRGGGIILSLEDL